MTAAPPPRDSALDALGFAFGVLRKPGYLWAPIVITVVLLLPLLVLSAFGPLNLTMPSPGFATQPQFATQAEVEAYFASIMPVLAVAVLWLHRPSRELALPALRALPDIIRLTRRLLTDPRTPLRHRVALAILVVWLVSPIDLIPEFLPGIGPLDDIVAAAVILGWVGRQTGTTRLRELWPGDAAGFTLVARMLRLPAE